MQKCEYLENEESFLDEKKIFIVFESLSFGEKIKVWWKIAGTRFIKAKMVLR